MPKYYVVSGQIKFIIDAKDELTAILATVSHYRGKGLLFGPQICINQKGFTAQKSKQKCYDTDKFLGM